MWEEKPKPIEETDPEIAEFFRQIVNKEVPYRVNGTDILDARTGGVVVLEEKVGRNDPCTCGSGKKYKKCCGKK